MTPASDSDLPKYQAHRFEACIFCGQLGKMTREHLWPDWLRQILPTTGWKNFVDYDVKGGVTHRAELGTGDPGSRRLRCACKSCNNGWMSDLQRQVRPVLEPMVMGHWLNLNQEQALVLAKWCTMTALVHAAMHHSRGGMTAEKRATFALNQEPFADWLIWIGRVRRGSHRRTTLHAAFEEPRGSPAHTHLASVSAGHFLFQAFWTDRAAYLPARWYAERRRLRTLWPSVDPAIGVRPAGWKVPAAFERTAYLFDTSVFEYRPPRSFWTFP